MSEITQDYIKTLRERKKTSHVYVRHQALGLAIADLLGDRQHKALYIKFAKEHDGELLLSVAKDVSTRSGIKNKGAYFMKIFGTFKKSLPPRSSKKKEALPRTLKQLRLRLRNRN